MAAVTLLRSVTAQIDLTVSAPADLVFSVAVSNGYRPLSESMVLTVDDQPVEFHEVEAPALARLHRAPLVPAGAFQLRYAAQVDEATQVVPEREVDELLYRRPSRYCDSDRLAQVAYTHFRGLTGHELVQAVREWVRANIAYTPGSSRVVDGALETYLSRKGVCRDSAHLVITFLRAMGLPARLVSVYAPGLVPMDFHAVAEVLLEGTWYVVDATGLAPRDAMVRIATGRDASDTAFLNTLAGRTQLRRLAVTATADGELLPDRADQLVQLP